MAEPSFDRIVFFKDIENTFMTVRDIVENYGVTSNTARNWVKLPGIKQVPGSYPYLYTHSDNNSPVENVKEVDNSIDLSKYIKFPDATTEFIDDLLENQVHENGGQLPDVIRKMVLGVKDETTLRKLEATMLTIIMTARRYYETEVKE